MNNAAFKLPMEVWIVGLVVVWTLCGALALLFFAKVSKSIRELRGEPSRHEISNQPIHVREALDFATKAEVLHLEEKIEERLSDQDAKRSRQVGELHESIRETERVLKAEIKDVAENTAFIRGQLDRMEKRS